MQLFLIAYFLFSTACFASDEILPAHCQEQVDTLIHTYFKDQEITIAPLLGGHSNTCLKITTDAKAYVLRIKDSYASEMSLKRELYAMQKGVEIGIAPQIYYVANDLKAVLMEYIEEPTVTFEEAKNPLNIAKIAQSIRKTHQTEKNPFIEESINDTATSVFLAIADTPNIGSQVRAAMELMWAYTKKLEALKSSKVNIHGELNARNIFLKDSGALFIDWEYTGWEDPFFDLSYLALRLDYNADEERVLLKNYLERAPSSSDLERYTLTKKIHLSQLCIFFNYFSLKFNTEGKELEVSSPLKSWSTYMQLFSDQDDADISLAQFYYDLAKVCLDLAASKI